jgi:hypothetical protein
MSVADILRGRCAPPIFRGDSPIGSDTNNPAALLLRASQSEAGTGWR